MFNQITDAVIKDNQVASLPDRMTGTAAENKAAFDALVKAVIAQYNETITTLLSQTAASLIGATAFEGVNGDTVQAQLIALQDNIKGVSAGSVPDGSVGTEKMMDYAITTAKLGELAVTAAKIAALAVTTAKLADGAVTESKLGSGAVSESKLGTSAVTADKIAALAVTNAKLAAGAVSEGKLADGAITTAKLGALAVTGAKIANSTIPIGKLSFTPAQYTVGVYTGNGESGYGEQNSLTFPFVPKMVLIVDETYGAMNYGSVCWMGQSFGASQVQFSLSNKTLSWYTTYDDSPEYQMNKFGDKYTYFAVG